MTGLQEFLVEKRTALLLRHKLAGNLTDESRVKISAVASAEGRSGIRRIRIRDFQIVSDSPANFAGYDLGATSPELLLGALASCLTHTYLIQAANLQVPLESICVETDGKIDLRAGAPGFEDIQIYPSEIRYIATISTTADDLTNLNGAVEKYCPILLLLRRGTEVLGEVQLNRPSYQREPLKKL